MTSTSNELARATYHFSSEGRAGDAGWGSLLALNHLILAPRAEMSPEEVEGVEIVTLVRRGVIAHAGTFGWNSRVVAGEVEIASPCCGYAHAFGNPGNKPAEYLEMRIAAASSCERTRRQVTKFPGRRQSGEALVLASGLVEQHRAAQLRSGARVLGARMPAGAITHYKLNAGRRCYLVPLTGEVATNGIILPPGATAAIIEEPILRIDSLRATEFLLIDTR